MPLLASSAPRVPRPLAGHDDAALVQALGGSGGEAAFAEIYERYRYELYTAAYRKLGGPELAEEVVHDVLAALWQRRAQLAIGHLKSYLLGAARFRTIDALRARLAYAHYLDHQRAHAPAAGSSTENVLAASDLSAALLAGLRQLPAHTQAVFRLSRFEHRSVPEIASRLNLSPKTVEYHLTRALKLLRVSLRDFVLLALGGTGRAQGPGARWFNFFCGPARGLAPFSDLLGRTRPRRRSPMTDPALQALLHRYCQGACTPAETRAVEAWYVAQPDGPEPCLAGAEREALRRRLWQRLRPTIAIPKQWATGAPVAWHWLAAAAVAAGLGVGSSLPGPRPNPAGAPAAWQVRYNATARAQVVQLPDGSNVALQPSSRLRYRPGFAGGQRAVYLSGEAFFRVAHDAAHPFRVLTADLETRVLGTSFTVRAYPQQAETVVQVRTGRVRVRPLRPASAGAPAQDEALAAAMGPLVLLPNQQAVYAPARQRLRRELVPQPAQLAPQPFAYDNRPVAEVLEALQAAYGVAIDQGPIVAMTAWPSTRAPSWP